MIDFKEATSRFSVDDVAGALGVSQQTVWQYRMDPDSTGYRRPPADWPAKLAELANLKSGEYAEMARELRRMK
jgi:hypothetical protein